jgi:hypothetical protein
LDRSGGPWAFRLSSPRCSRTVPCNPIHEASLVGSHMILRPRSATPPRPYTTPPGTNISLEDHSPPSRPPHPDHDSTTSQAVESLDLSAIGSNWSVPEIRTLLRDGLGLRGVAVALIRCPPHLTVPRNWSNRLPPPTIKKSAGLHAGFRLRQALTRSNLLKQKAPASPHSPPPNRHCTTNRDFVPWRFSNAGRISARQRYHSRHPKTLYHNMYFFLYLGFFVRLEARFFVPTQLPHAVARRGCQGWPSLRYLLVPRRCQ